MSLAYRLRADTGADYAEQIGDHLFVEASVPVGQEPETIESYKQVRGGGHDQHDLYKLGISAVGGRPRPVAEIVWLPVGLATEIGWWWYRWIICG